MPKWIIVLIVLGLLVIIAGVVILIVFCKPKPKSKQSTVERLDSITNPLFRAPKLAPGNPVSIYGSASMFCLADYLYAVGPGGIRGNFGTFKGNWSMIAGASVLKRLNWKPSNG